MDYEEYAFLFDDLDDRHGEEFFDVEDVIKWMDDPVFGCSVTFVSTAFLKSIIQPDETAKPDLATAYHMLIDSYLKSEGSNG